MVVDIEEKKIELEFILKGLNSPQPVYSIAHLFEAKQKSNLTDEFIVARCGFLHRLTQSTYVEFNQVSLRNEICNRAPLSVCDQIPSGLIDYMNDHIEQLSPIIGAIISIEDFPLKPIMANNLSPTDFLNKVNEFLLARTGKSMSDFFKENTSGNHRFFQFDLSKIVETLVLFHLIDELGFHPDGKGKVRSRMFDALHVHFASVCDVFITSDSKMFHKASAVFQYYGLNTKTVFVQ